MDEIRNEIPNGVIVKSGSVGAIEVSPEDLRKINKFALSPLSAEDVFVFKAEVGDNELDDRNYEPFTLQALKDMQKLYIGKTVIKDHRRTADNQIARIFDSELVSEAKQTSGGEPYARLIVKAYMVKTASNADLIAEIKGGIKREVSSSCIPKRAVCSVCGQDNMKTYCPHLAGCEYEGKTCLITLDGAKDVHELSFVAVPAQPRAGTRKHYGSEPIETPDVTPEIKSEEPIEPIETPEDNTEKFVDLRLHGIDAFLTTNIEE